MPIEQYDLRVLIRHYWRKGLSILKAIDEFAQLVAVEILPHPACSPDVVPSDYGLSFDQCNTFFKDRRFETFNEVQEACQEFFNSKEPPWYFQQIRFLVERWKKVMDYDGLYFEE